MTDAVFVAADTLPRASTILCVWCGRTKPHPVDDCLSTLMQTVKHQRIALETKNTLIADLQHDLRVREAKLNAIRREAA